MSGYKKPFKETHQSIADQTRAFLESGGKIEKVPSGYTGQAKLTGNKHTFLAPGSKN